MILDSLPIINGKVRSGGNHVSVEAIRLDKFNVEV
jgi:hypothetical protein